MADDFGPAKTRRIMMERRRQRFSTMAMVALMVAITATLSTIAAEEEPLHRQLFPSSDEYDSKILDPKTVFGSPYGGFSRATRSRLAALPLRLPDMATLEEDEDEEDDDGDDDNSNMTTDDAATYMETSDGLGRGYVCRVYHEDSLDPSSLHDSMFDRPRIRDKEAEAEAQAAERAAHENIREMFEEGSDDINEEEEDDEDDRAVQDAIDHDLLMMETHRRLKKLEGVCSQIHKGWWSYEWCFENIVTQFHIHVAGHKTAPGLELQDVTSLGKYSRRKIRIKSTKAINDEKNTAVDDDDDDDFPVVNKYAKAEPELAQVVDIYTDGEKCDVTGEPRVTKVKYFCCSDTIMEQTKGPVLRKQIPVTSKIVSIVNLLEDPKEVCTYSITVCTPLLCEDVHSDEDDSLLYDVSVGSVMKTSTGASSRQAKLSPSASKSSPRSLSSSPKPKKENESIRDILDRTIGQACIQSSTTGWWSYEYCHRKHVRQFHESITINTETGLASTGTEDIYMLGFYDSELDSFLDEEEWKHIVNITSVGSGGGNDKSSASKTKGKVPKGVAAYFESEYNAGDVCDDPDVTDAAIKAGSVGGGHSERACSVRYSCGTKFDIYVNEDSTCHYVVEITVPDLCDHPFFKVPEAKKRVVKCLPVEDANEWDIQS